MGPPPTRIDPASAATCDVFTVQRADVCWPPTTVTARRYINDRRTADADKPRSGPLCHAERVSRGNGCFRIFESWGWCGLEKRRGDIVMVSFFFLMDVTIRPSLYYRVGLQSMRDW